MSELVALAPETRNLIDGALVEASSGAMFDNIDPATGKVIGQCSDGTKEDAAAAIAAARRAFDDTTWSREPAFRARCLRQLYDALLEDREQLRTIVVHEAGSPLLLTRQVQCDTYIEAMPFWAELAERYEYEREVDPITFLGRSNRILMRREAGGVVGAITPWNFPLYLNLCKIGPALAAGCSIVLKPAPDTPWSATHLGRLIAEKTDIPAGVVNIVASSDHLVGEVLATDPRVDMVTFTGSTTTGKRVAECAAGTVKRVFLELGGKSANVVLDDADLGKVMPFVGTVCTHAGQGCAIPTRLLLARSLYEEGVELAKTAFENVPYGDPKQGNVLMGPVVSRRQQERVLSYIEQGKGEGARLLVGGGVPSHLPDGFFVEPTLFVDVDPGATIAQEEIFGPVLCVIPFEDDDDAVRIANDSIYGLSGAVSSASDERSLAVARRIRAGTLSVNGSMWFSERTPFGGFKQSGIGRENGVLGFEEYTEVKMISLPGRP